jgi:hypothetical protein
MKNLLYIYQCFPILINHPNMQKFWSIRQNPWATTNQTDIRNFILSTKILTCPFGHLGQERNNVLDGTFNNNQPWSSSSQDTTFCNEVEIGDIVLIPFKSQRNCILAKVTSAPECFMKTGFYTTLEQNGAIRIQNNGEIPFCPIGRKIEILSTTVVFEDKRKWISMKSLSQLSPPTVEIVKRHCLT